MTRDRAQYLKAYAAERRRKGICLSCGDPAMTGKSLCGKCRKKASDRSRNKYRANHGIPYDDPIRAKCEYIAPPIWLVDDVPQAKEEKD